MQRKFILFLGFVLFLLAGLLPCTSKAENNYPWPFSVQKGNRFLLDKMGKPYWLNGDAAWSLLVQPDLKDARAFIEHRAKQGINALIVNILERKYSDKAPATTEGNIAPFLVPNDLRTPNEEYFKRLDYLVGVAEKAGVTLLLAPAYLGYLDVGDGWYNVLLQNGVEACRKYALFVAKRYAHRPNIIWIIGGDHNPDKAWDHLNVIAQTILSVNNKSIITAHCHPFTSPRIIYQDAGWMNLSNVYHYGVLTDAIQREYLMAPEKPFIMIESTYENEWDSSPQQQRSEQWWAVCGGATGGFMGNNPVWNMRKGWKDQWDSPAAKALSIVKQILDTIPWMTYKPDLDKEILVSGWGGYYTTDRAGFAFGKNSAIGYFPNPREITLTLKTTTKLIWINPENGEVLSVESLPANNQKITVPGECYQDRLLMLYW